MHANHDLCYVAVCMPVMTKVVLQYACQSRKGLYCSMHANYDKGYVAACMLIMTRVMLQYAC